MVLLVTNVSPLILSRTEIKNFYTSMSRNKQSQKHLIGRSYKNNEFNWPSPRSQGLRGEATTKTLVKFILSFQTIKGILPGFLSPSHREGHGIKVDWQFDLVIVI